MSTRFHIVTADGREFRNVRVHGNGGEVTDPQSVFAFLRLTASSRRDPARILCIFQPTPGHCLVREGDWQSESADEIEHVVPLVGATVYVTELSPQIEWSRGERAHYEQRRRTDRPRARRAA